MTFNCQGTANAVCPHCGYEDHDSWEIGCADDGDYEATCNSCGEDFSMSRTISVSYTTTKLPPVKEADK